MGFMLYIKAVGRLFQDMNKDDYRMLGRVRLSSDLEESCISREYDKSKRIAGLSLDLAELFS